MKRLLLLAFVVAISLASFAQLSVGASAGYQLNGRVHGYYGTVNFKDNANYGVQVAYWIDQFTAVEFNYTGHSSDAIVEYPPGEKARLERDRIGFSLEAFALLADMMQ